MTRHIDILREKSIVELIIVDVGYFRIHRPDKGYQRNVTELSTPSLSDRE